MALSAIQLERLAFAYPDGRPALREVSLSIAPGERVALVGPNGAGKSTLLLHLNGILRPHRGAVHICGTEVQERTLAQVRTWVGMVFQNPDDQLFSPTVFDDVAFGLLYQGATEAEVRARVAEALAAVQLSDYAGRMPHHLSVGEKKRVALATVLALRPRILALDEPTAALDPRGRRSFIRLLRDLPQTLVAATHDMRLVAELFPRMVILSAGQVVADGPAAALLSDTALMELHGLVE